MKRLRFRVLDYGNIENKRNIVIASAAPGSMVDSPIPGILIEHPTLGTILYDTGNPLTGAAVMGERGKEFNFHRIHYVTDCLEELGKSVQDVDRIILSHLHMDHAGGLPAFANTKAAANGVIVSQPEAMQAFYKVHVAPDPGFYARSTFEDIPDLKWEPINGTVALAEDLILFTQEAHTPGVIGLVLKTEHNGNFIMASDACYSIENYETQTPPGGISEEWQQKFIANLAVLEEMQRKYDAQLIFGHDVVQAPSMMGKWFD